jgi:hypothetical protein
LFLATLFGCHPTTALLADEITPSCSSVSADTELALQYFPDELVSEFTEVVGSDVPVSRTVCALRADLDATGRPDYLVAAYSNGLTGMVRVISRTGVPSVVAQNERAPKMGSEMPFLSLIDVDRDGRPEIFVAYHTRQNVDGWLLRWRDRRLQHIGPLVTSAGMAEKLTQLHVPSLEDLDGDGVLELFQNTSTVDDPGRLPAVRVFKLTPTGFAESGLYAWCGTYTRVAGAPTAFRDEFRRPAEGDYVLQVASGDRTGKAKVSAATIVLNGKEVVGPADFKRSERVFTVPVTLLDTNDLRVELQSAPGSELTLTVFKR